MLGIDDHVLSLVRYSMQGDLLSFVVGGKHIVQSNNCHISADILCGNRVLTAGIRDEAVFLYPAQIYFVYVPFPVSWTVKMKKKQTETQDILSYHTQAAGCSDKARAKASGGRQPIEECGRTGL